MGKCNNYCIEKGIFHLCIQYLLTAKTTIQPIAIPAIKPTGENPSMSLEFTVDSNPP